MWIVGSCLCTCIISRGKKVPDSPISPDISSFQQKSSTNTMSKPSRIILTPHLAMEIYAHKLLLQTPRDFGSCLDAAGLLKGQSTQIAKKYNVSAKTIRDIWNRRTWTFATCSLWRGELSKSAASAPYSQVSKITESPNLTRLHMIALNHA